MARGKKLTPSGRIETSTERNRQMAVALSATVQAASLYDADPEAFEKALDELVISCGTIGANIHTDGPSETLLPPRPSRDSLTRRQLGWSLLWGCKEGLPESLRSPLYPVVLTESRWRRLRPELRTAITYRSHKRETIGRPAQYAYELLRDNGLAPERLSEFEAAMLAYA